MPTINDITNAASYKGDAALGGGGGTPINIDWKPLEQLAQYTYLYNRDQYQQRQKDADEKIKQLAYLSALDISKARGNDIQVAGKALDEVTNLYSDFMRMGTPKSPSEKLAQNSKLLIGKKKAIDTINRINEKGIQYDLLSNGINADATLSADQKNIYLKALDERQNSSDTPVELPAFTMDLHKLPTTPTLKAEIYKIGDNQIVEKAYELPDFGAAKSLSTVANMSIEKPLMPDSTELQGLTEKEKGNKMLQSYLQQKANKNGWSAMGEVFNNIKDDPKFKTNGNIDINKLMSNDATSGISSLIIGYNNKATDMKNRILNGEFTDKDGKVLNFVNRAFKLSDYEPINFEDGISGNEIAQAVMIANAPSEKQSVIVTNTGAADKIKLEQIQQAGQTKREQIKQSGANYIARLPYIMAKIGSGTATADELSDYPILKTRELVETIGTGGQIKNFTELTQEQQAAINAQSGNSLTSTETVQIEGNKINVTGNDKDGKPITITVIPDDVTKFYYDNINKNDAGKESVKRQYFKLGTTKDKSADPTAGMTPEQKLAFYKNQK